MTTDPRLAPVAAALARIETDGAALDAAVVAYRQALDWHRNGPEVTRAGWFMTQARMALADAAVAALQSGAIAAARKVVSSARPRGTED